MSTGFFISTLAVAAVGEAAIASDGIDLGGRLGNLSASGVLGVIAIFSMIMLWRVYRDKNKAELVTREIAMKAVAAIEKNNERTEREIQLLKEMHGDISLCRKLNIEKIKEARLTDTQKMVIDGEVSN